MTWCMRSPPLVHQNSLFLACSIASGLPGKTEGLKMLDLIPKLADLRKAAIRGDAQGFHAVRTDSVRKRKGKKKNEQRNELCLFLNGLLVVCRPCILFNRHTSND